MIGHLGQDTHAEQHDPKADDSLRPVMPAGARKYLSREGSPRDYT